MQKKILYFSLLRNSSVVLFLWVSMILVACTEQHSLPAADRLLADESQEADWLAYGRTHREQRCSPLQQIDTATISRLAPEWWIDLPNDIALVSTPLVVDGVLYFTGTMNIVRAVDATTGKGIWSFDPEVGKQAGIRRRAGWTHSRGITYYDGLIYEATWDGRLIALDAKTGKMIWSTLTVAPGDKLNITGVPKACKGKIIIGNGGSESGPTRGYVTAYDAKTGQQAWRFYIVPGNPADGFENKAMEMAAKTWSGEWWKLGGGGNAWHGLTYDPELDLLYIGTGNGGPWNRNVRSPGGGDNLFLCSIVALDPDDGSYRWHYQTTPGESWDYNSCMDMILADLVIGGKPVKVILHAPKNGFFYVIDRQEGKLISAKPFVQTTWASHVDVKTGRPVETFNARYDTGSALISPSPHGAHSWQAMSFNPATGLAYLPVMHDAVRFTTEGMDLEEWKRRPDKGGIGTRIEDAEHEIRKQGGSLLAWDPVQQKEVWSVDLPELWNAGTLTTMGRLVFQGQANGKFVAYAAATGRMLWTFDAGLGISAPPITYAVGGKQYVAILVGWGGAFAGVGNRNLGWSYGRHKRRLISFALDGRAKVPDQPPPYYPQPLRVADFQVDTILSKRGAAVYGACSGCHNGNLEAKGMAPDLRASPVPVSAAAFRQVVKEGSLSDRGMPAFPELSEEDLKALMHHIRKVAHEDLSKTGKRVAL